MQVQVAAAGQPNLFSPPAAARGPAGPVGGRGRWGMGVTDGAIPRAVLNLFISPLDAPDGSLATETHFRGKLTHEY
ncbi:hypothetical protein E2C01_074594 [Portunus trituberculatus]|uniref:Uncharacterized protein n=1 Tax=Portunus trituberculatus TaxID=210409 RepID=A0A5B7I3P5_PORTR|nr:hypothetical protein [Portunus trituberculatus]